LPCSSADGVDWTTISTIIPFGAHEIAFCLEVEAGSGDWSARLDNVIAERMLIVPAAQASWGRIKSLYR